MRGLAAAIFVDLGPSFTCLDPTGESMKSAIVEHIVVVEEKARRLPAPRTALGWQPPLPPEGPPREGSRPAPRRRASARLSPYSYATSPYPYRPGLPSPTSPDLPHHPLAPLPTRVA